MHTSTLVVMFLLLSLACVVSPTPLNALLADSVIAIGPYKVAATRPPKDEVCEVLLKFPVIQDDCKKYS